MKFEDFKDNHFVQNAMIVNVTLDFERGILTSYLMIEFDSGGQGFGGFVLLNPTYPLQDFTGLWITRILETLEITDWLKISNTYCRVVKEYDFGDIIGIGHIVKDQWFFPKDEFEQKKGG